MPSPNDLFTLAAWLDRHRLSPRSLRIDEHGAQVTIGIDDLRRLVAGEPKVGGRGWAWARVEGVQVIGVVEP